MSLNKIVSGDFGQPIRLTVLDVDTGAAADLSGYTGTPQILLTDPDWNIAAKDAAYVTDGSDGLVQYTLAEDDIDKPGTWYIEVRVINLGATARLTSEKLSFVVLKETTPP